VTRAPAESAFAQGLATLNAGDLAAAEADLNACLAQAPTHQAALLNLGVLLMRLKRFAEAEDVLTRLVRLAPIPDAYLALAVIFENTQRRMQAEQSLMDALKADPVSVGLLTATANFYARHGLAAEAATYWRKLVAIEPQNVTATLRFAESAWDTTPAESVAALQRLLPLVKDVGARVQVLGMLTSFKEWQSRRENGLMPYHASTLDELFFTFAKEEFAELYRLTTQSSAPPDSLPALAQRCTSYFAAGELERIDQTVLAGAAFTTGTIWGCLRFASAFHDELAQQSDAALFGTLPQIVDVRPASQTERATVYLSCDTGYFFAFALPMVRSLADQAPGTPLHLHIMDADAVQGQSVHEACANLPLTVSITQEEVPDSAKRSKAAARNYFHAVRLVRYYQHMVQMRRPLWLMDVDGLFNRTPDGLFAQLDDHDVALRARPGRFEPWNQFNASVVGAAATPAAHDYFRRVAAYIAHHYQRDTLTWGIDQLAMYAVYLHLARAGSAPRLALLGDRDVDYDYADDGIIWCNSGGAKHMKSFEGLRAKSSSALPRLRYDERFKRYAEAAGST